MIISHFRFTILDLHIGAIRIWTKPSRKKPKIVFRCQNRRYSQFLHFSHKIYINTFPTKKIRSDSSKWQGRSNLSKLGLRTKFQKDKDLDPARGSCYGSWIWGIWLIFTKKWVLVGGSESSWGHGRCSRWFLGLLETHTWAQKKIRTKNIISSWRKNIFKKYVFSKNRKFWKKSENVDF